MPTAVITGASSGIGAEYARQLAARGADVVLVARDRAALDALAHEIRSRHGVHVEVLAADLLDAGERAAVETRLRSAAQPVEVLVNNAGFGLPLDFERNDIEAEAAHLALHVEVPMRLMHAALEGMCARGSGRILNIASVAAFIPRSTYGAAKGWIVSFSRWANARYAPRGVTVTAVCPGFTHTDFHRRMGLEAGSEGVPAGLWLNAAFVVRASLRDAARGRPVSIPSLRYRLLVALTRVVPSTLAARVGESGR